MQFFTFTTLALAALTSSAFANSITFVNLDGKARTVCWFPAAGKEDIPCLRVNGYGIAVAQLPLGWSGSFRTIFDDGNPFTLAVRGEVTFQGDQGKTFYDVSAIDNCCGNTGVHLLQPKIAKQPLSGCAIFPCSDSYNKPDDVQTKVTTETDLTCGIGFYGQ